VPLSFFDSSEGLPFYASLSEQSGWGRTAYLSVILLTQTESCKCLVSVCQMRQGVSTTVPKVRGCDRSGAEEEMSPNRNGYFQANSKSEVRK
jgi:hypothetical protein